MLMSASLLEGLCKCVSVSTSPSAVRIEQLVGKDLQRAFSPAVRMYKYPYLVIDKAGFFTA